MRVLMIGDVVGGPGRRAVAALVPRLRAERGLDLVVCNAENAAGGRGITLALAQEFFAVGVDVLTLGDHAWDQKELVPVIDREPRILRPANLPPGCPGKGWLTVRTPKGPATVVGLLGRVFMGVHPDCPFRAADALLAGGAPAPLGPVFVEVHAEATSEKMALGWHLDGRAAAVVGSHTHVQTSDERVLPKGTAFLTDLGMTGPRTSILGRDIPSVMQRFRTGMPAPFKVATDDVVLEGALVEVQEASGRATRIERVREPLPG